jgi:hypothetical protein
MNQKQRTRCFPVVLSGAVRRKSMESATFQKWLAEQGCRFDSRAMRAAA